MKSNPEPRATIRALTPGDAMEMMRLRHQAIGEIPTAFGTSPKVELAKGVVHYHRHLMRIMGRRGEEILGLWNGNRLIGMSGVGRRRHQGVEHALVYSMYVLPEERNQGHAAELLEACARLAREKWGLATCRLNVETGNERALRLYVHAGFRVVNREEDAFRLDGQSHAVYHLERTGSP